jgi:hypothetical protein
MQLARVTDLAGNPMSTAYTWSFVMQDFGVKDASVQISGLKLNLPFNNDFNMPSNTFIKEVTSAISERLQVWLIIFVRKIFAPMLLTGEF